MGAVPRARLRPYQAGNEDSASDRRSAQHLSARRNQGARLRLQGRWTRRRPHRIVLKRWHALISGPVARASKDGPEHREPMKCQLCGHEHPIEFLNLGQQPLANKYPTEAGFATEDFFPLAVFFCKQCKNVQLGTMVSRARMFEDY